jgi:hypothetical protein
MFSRKTLSYGVIALAGVLAPFSFDASSGSLRLQQACGQATSCIENYNYLCSTYHGDRDNMACATGCGS